MNRKFAIFEMAAAVVLFFGMVCCSISTWYHADDLFASSRETLDSYIVVVRDGRVIFEKFRPFFPRCEKPLRSAGGHVDNLVGRCRWAAGVFAKVPWKGDKLQEFPLQLAQSFDDLKTDLDNLAAVLRDMYDGEGYNDLRRAFDNTETSLNKTKHTLDDISRNLRFMVFMMLVVTGILCCGLFVHGMARLKRS